MFTFMDICIIIFAHWIGDFVCQTHWQATNKSKNNFALLSHVMTYTLVIVFFGIFLLYPNNLEFGLIWAVGNGIVHFFVDYVTSRITSRLWSAGKIHDFFVMVGFDQVIHYFCLFGSIILLLKFMPM